MHRFSDGIKEVTFEDFIEANSNHTKEDFLEIKRYFDGIQNIEVLADSKYKRKDY